MSDSIVRKIQPFTIGTKLSVPAGPKCSHLTDGYVPSQTIDNCKLRHNLNEQVSLCLGQSQGRAVETRNSADRCGEKHMAREHHLNRNKPSPTATSRSIRKITICSNLESNRRVVTGAERAALQINPNTENLNNNNNTTASAQQLKIVRCENKPNSHFKVLPRKGSDDEQYSSIEQTNGFLLNREKCSDVQWKQVFESRVSKKDIIKRNTLLYNPREVTVVSNIQKDCCFNQQNALFSKEISQAEAWIQGKLNNLRDSANMQSCSMAEWEEVSRTLWGDLKDFENTLIQLNKMGEQLMCKLNPTSDWVRKQLSQLRDQWRTLKQRASSQTKAAGGAPSLQEFNKKVDQLEIWIKEKEEEEQSLAGLLGENIDKLQLTRRRLDLKQDEQLHRNLHEEINNLALKLEKQGKVESKNVSTRRKHINKMWLKVQSHLKDCLENLQVALEVSSFYQQADNIICSLNNMTKSFSVTGRAGVSGDGEIRDIASEIMVLDVAGSQLSNLHTALATRVAQKQTEVKDSWLLLQSAVRNEKAVQLHSATWEDGDLPASNREPFKSVGTSSHRIMGKEVRDEPNWLKGSTVDGNYVSPKKSQNGQVESHPNLSESLGCMYTSDGGTRFQMQGKSGAPSKPKNHYPQLHVQLQKFTVCADKTLSWLKDSVTMATHVCSSVEGIGSYEIAKEYQASLKQDILSNKVRIELVKKEGYNLVRAQHPGSAKIHEFLSQLDVLWEELESCHQKNAVVLLALEDRNHREVRALQTLGSLEAWLQAVELSIKQASLAGDPESVSVAEQESCLLEKELETRGLELQNLRWEVDVLCSQGYLNTHPLPARVEEVERKFNNVQAALMQQSSELKDTRMLTEFLERVELEESNCSILGQPLKSDLDSDPLPPFAGSRRSEPVMESLGDPVEELREAVEMLNDTARKRGHSLLHDHSIQDLLNKHFLLAPRVEQCLQRCTEFAVDVLEMEREMAIRCEPERCGLDSLEEQQDQLEIDFDVLKEDVAAMESLSAHLSDLCPERVHALKSKVQGSLQAWEQLRKSVTENKNRLLQFSQLRHFFRNYLAVISWTEDTRSRIFSESALRRGQESHGSMVDIMDQQIEQKFQDFDLLAAEGKKLLNEDHPLAKMVKERMEELRSMLSWILVHWRAQKDQWLSGKRAEESHNSAIYSEATACSVISKLESETTSENQKKRAECFVTVPHCGLEEMKQDNGCELMKNVNPKNSFLEERDSSNLVLKEPITHSLGSTVNLILSFTNSEDKQLQVQEPDHKKVQELSEAVYRVSTYLDVKDTIQAVAPVYESMTLPGLHGMVHSPSSFSPCTSLCSSSSSPEVDSTSLDLLSRNGASSVFCSLTRKSKRRKKKIDIRRHTVQRTMGGEPSEEESPPSEYESVTCNMHTWPLKETKQRKSGRKSKSKETQFLDYVKNPLVKDIDAECSRGLSSQDSYMIVEQPAMATADHLKNHCRFLSLGSVLSFELPRDVTHIPCTQDIITIAPADFSKIAHQDKDSHAEHSTDLSTFKLARSQPAHKHDELKHTAPGKINLNIDCQDSQKIHIDAISVSQNECPVAPLAAEDIPFEENQTSSFSNLISEISGLPEKAHVAWDQIASQMKSSDHQPIVHPTSIKEHPEKTGENILISNHRQSSTTENHIWPRVHTLIHSPYYHKVMSPCPRRTESPTTALSHASPVLLNVKASGGNDSVDSGHSSSGNYKICPETTYLNGSVNPAHPVKLFSLEAEEFHRNLECLKTNSPLDDPLHPDHQQFEQEEEELEDIWNQTNSFRQSICSDIMYQGIPTEPTSSSPGQRRETSPKEQAVLVRKMITATSAPNLLVTEFGLLSSIQNVAQYRKDWRSKDGAHIFPQHGQPFKEAVVINETASEPVKLPELMDQQKYIYQYEVEQEEEEMEGDRGCMKDQSSLLSVHMDLEWVATSSEAQGPNPNTRVQSTTSPVSGRQEVPSMEGTLERKHKLLLGGRRALCRAWSSCHAVLYKQTLCFYQDRKDMMRNSITTLPLNLIGAECVSAPEYTKKPNCFTLRLHDGSEYLLSAPSRFMMKKWILRIQANAESSKSEAKKTSGGPTAQVTFSGGSSRDCQCRTTCQYSKKREDHLIYPSHNQLVSSAGIKEIVVLARNCSHVSQWHYRKTKDLSPSLSANADSLGVLLEQRLHSQSRKALSSSFSPSQDFSTSKRHSQSFTSATYQRIKPVHPAGRSQNSNSNYSVTLFIGDSDKQSVCNTAALSQPTSCRQHSFSELPLRGYASLPWPHNKSIFRKFFGKKE